jgi:hypothetical protein
VYRERGDDEDCEGDDRVKLNKTISNQLYHFTGYDKINNAFKLDEDAFNILQSILGSQYLRLSPNEVEVHLPAGGLISSTKVNVKMACLTETPIEFISEHIDKYGKFGLGFSIEWALTNSGLNVIYTEKNNPNSFAHTISELGDFFRTNGMLSHDRRAISWIAQLTVITEKFELRHEREWRFLRAPKMLDGYSGIAFSSNDLHTIICPEYYVSKIQDVIANTKFNPEIIPTEQVWKPNKIK